MLRSVFTAYGIKHDSGTSQPEGGVSENHLAVHLAAALLAEKGRTLLRTPIPKGSAVSWSSQRESAPPFTVTALAKPTIHHDD